MRMLPEALARLSRKAWPAAAPGMRASANRAISDVAGCSSIGVNTGIEASVPIRPSSRNANCFPAAVAFDCRNATSLASICFSSAGEASES
jgi:hypothetical protein